MKKRKRKGKNRLKEAFIVYPANTDYKIRFSLTRPLPKMIRERRDLEDFFFKYGVARVFDVETNALRFEVWMGSQRIRVGTETDIDTFLEAYYARQGVEKPKDLTREQVFGGYLIGTFSRAACQAYGIPHTEVNNANPDEN